MALWAAYAYLLLLPTSDWQQLSSSSSKFWLFSYYQEPLLVVRTEVYLINSSNTIRWNCKHTFTEQYYSVVECGDGHDLKWINWIFFSTHCLFLPYMSLKITDIWLICNNKFRQPTVKTCDDVVWSVKHSHTSEHEQ